MQVRECAIAFIAGAALDLLYVRWVKDIGLNRPFRAAGASMAIGLFGLLGLGQAIHGGWPAVSYVVGLGVGTIIAIKHPLKDQADAAQIVQ